MKLIKRLLAKKDVNGEWVCWAEFLCEIPQCGKIVIRRLSNGKKAKSCGCNVKNNYKHGESHTRLHNIWIGMKQRVLNPNKGRFKDYGGRGITICDEWLDKDIGFINFRNWSVNNGYVDNLVIDRINPNGNYEPSNCRFLTALESLRNKTNTITMEIAEEIRELNKTGNYTRKQLAEKYDVSRSTITSIINNKTWKNSKESENV